MLKKERRIREISTAGAVESLSTSPGSGVHYIYTTDWEDAFKNIDKKLVKISTTYGDGVSNYLGVFTYKKGGFKDYKIGFANAAMPFCFKKEGEKLVLAAKAQLGKRVSLWILGKPGTQ